MNQPEDGINPVPTPSPKVVIPVETGIQCFRNSWECLDSGFRRNDDSRAFSPFEESIDNSLTSKTAPG